jgi:hypothetical protein
MNSETKKKILAFAIYSAQFACIVALAATIVCLFYSGAYLLCTAFFNEEPWYSTLKIIASLALFTLSHWLFVNPYCPAFWHHLIKTHLE